MTTPSSKRKQSLYFSDEMLKEVYAEAARLDRSLSWIVQFAWNAGKEQLAAMPSVNPPKPTEDK